MSVNALLFVELMSSLHPPIRSAGAYRIASEIRKAGYTCQVVDYFTKFSEDEIKKIMQAYIGPDTLIIGFSSTFFEKIDSPKSNLPFIRNLETRTRNYPYDEEKMEEWFKEIYSINPDVKIVLGGANSAGLHGPGDAFAIGYCDQAIVEYMNFIDGKNPFFQYEKVNDNQLAFYGSHFTNKFDFSSSTIQWDSTDHLQHAETVPIEIGRGCIFSCSFCNAPNRGKKKLEDVKKASVLRDEFLRNYNEFGITRYTYADDTHNDSIEKLEMLHRVVTSLPFQIEYGAYLRHDLINAHKETAALLLESGLRGAYFGIESLNHRTSRSIGKGLHPEKTKELMHWLREDVWKNEVGIMAGFIVGLPYDSPESVSDWSAWLLSPSCPLHSVEINPLNLPSIKSGIRSNFEIAVNDGKYGYTIDQDGNWKNEFFTKATAVELVTKLVITRNKMKKFGFGGFLPVLLSNVGFEPKEIINIENTNELWSLVYQRRELYLNKYKVSLMDAVTKIINIDCH